MEQTKAYVRMCVCVCVVYVVLFIFFYFYFFILSLHLLHFLCYLYVTTFHSLLFLSPFQCYLHAIFSISFHLESISHPVSLGIFLLLHF